MMKDNYCELCFNELDTDGRGYYISTKTYLFTVCKKCYENYEGDDDE